MSSPAQPTTRLRDHRPEPSNLWIRHAAVWPAPVELVWVDLARGGLGTTGSPRPGGGRRFSAPVDVLYLPPAAAAEEQAAVTNWCVARHLPFYVQHVLGPDTPIQPGGLGTLVVDPLVALIEGRLEYLENIPAESLVVWPTLPGLTDLPDLLESGLRRLQLAGLTRVVPLGVTLSPAAGRILTDRFGEQVFDSVFHSGDVDLRPVARACREFGLAFLPPRPELPGVPALARRVVSELAMIGELWVVSGESPARAQEFFRAAVWVEESRFDVGALVRDGNLGIVPALSARSSEVIAELAAGGARSALLTQLVERFGAGS